MTRPARRDLSIAFITLVLACGVRAETVTIVGGNVYTMRHDLPVRADILIQDGRIAAVEQNLRVPPESRVITADGLTVTPALMNSGTELGLVEIDSIDATVDHGTALQTLGAAFDIQYGINHRSLLIERARADGLSYAVVMPVKSGNPPFSGLGALLHLRSPLAETVQTGIGLFAELGERGDADLVASRAALWTGLRRGLEEARALRSARGVQARDSTFNRTDLEAIRRVVDGSIPLVVTAHRESDITQCLALADDFGIEVIVRGGAEAWMLADALAAAAIPVILDPGNNLPLYFDRLHARSDAARILDSAGVLIAFELSGIHRNHNAAYGLREAAGLAVANGLDYASALRALTVNPALIWGIDDRYGTIDVGKAADLAIWSGDPLEPLTILQHVLINGEPIDINATHQERLLRRYLE